MHEWLLNTRGAWTRNPGIIRLYQLHELFDVGTAQLGHITLYSNVLYMSAFWTWAGLELATLALSGYISDMNYSR